ncbi:glycosyltransferase [Paraburkholderia humisilvae]|uniref:N-acetylgalactosamine-N, N'-diacetylbacillosaminyl-diphospho-undecaprenol 4-alpha-N-acetylgalactosaminyltransferase n=1 Tax=Paraburkholderia humisilvae TaxID=627669 RepID=A0A6J5DIM1_9BURK|nr:glycosyltransferase [Paraburkholderia humisilvae]CAB3753783.1 N-acetylgalactosamine-N, N'-diacetylbacillosaminyl-diphospho-undecaprenol 4-alpha-N-acetylgalactosaminyltransferase [Paraburkholderia humisilvae]
MTDDNTHGARYGAPLGPQGDDDADIAADVPARPLRILFHINDFGKGGTETSLLSWLNVLDRRFFTPSVSVGYPTDDLAYWLAKSIPHDVQVHVLAPSKWMHTLHNTARRRKMGAAEKLVLKALKYGAIRPLAARRFRELVREHDVICDFDFSLRHLAGHGGVPWFGVSHFSLATRLGKKSARYVERRVSQFRRYSAIAVLTPDMEREAHQLFGACPLRIMELPNVIDVDAIRRDARAPIDDRPPGPYIASVARLDEGQKDHATLLRAYALLRERGHVATDLVLIGEGPDRGMLERLAKELDVAEHVHFMGFRSNPFPYIRQAEMLVLSSRYEGLPMVLREAMAIGTPVLSSDCPTGPRDLLDGGRAGLLAPPGDAQALAHEMQRLLTDRALRKSLITNGLAKADTFAPMHANRRMLTLARMLSAKIDPAS